MLLQNSMLMFHAVVLDAEGFHNLRRTAFEPGKRGKAVFPSCLQSLMDREAREAAQSGNPYVLRNALDQQEPNCWDAIMYAAIKSGRLDCVKDLYDKGYEQYHLVHPVNLPAVYATLHGNLEILRFVVDRSGLPVPLEDICISAVSGGVEMLQYVRQLGCVFDEKTTQAAARHGDLEALRYLHMSGVPWNSWTLAAAIWAKSLPCLKFAHMHGCPQEDEERGTQVEVKSLPVLQYVCEHMDPAFAAKTLEFTASHLDNRVRPGRPQEYWENELEWPLVSYLGRKLGAALPNAVAKVVATRKERAAALAGVFWKARKQLNEEETRLRRKEAAGGARAQRLALWDAMARVPKELQERIAVEAHLIIL
jgi:hypothetical protein